MAAINIGRVLPIFKGTYNSSTTYNKLDVVLYNGSSYVANCTTTAVVPTNTTNWTCIAKASCWENFTAEEKQELLDSLAEFKVVKGNKTFNDF